MQDQSVDRISYHTIVIPSQVPKFEYFIPVSETHDECGWNGTCLWYKIRNKRSKKFVHTKAILSLDANQSKNSLTHYLAPANIFHTQ